MRIYSNTAGDTVLTADPGASGLTITGVDFTGWPSPSSGDTALACIEIGTSAVELAEYTSRTSTSLTLSGRGVDGTTAISHAVGASVRHVASAADVQAFMRYGEAGNSSLLASTWYLPPGVMSMTTGAIANGTIREVPFSVPARQRFLGIGVDVATIAATGLIRLSIYRTQGNGKPAALVLHAGTVGATATGLRYIAIDVTLPRGMYHLAVSTEVVSVTLRLVSTYFNPVRVPGLQTFGTNFVNTGWTATVSAGAHPDPFPVGMTAGSGQPIVALLTA